MRINEKLNMVWPLYRDGAADPYGYVHSTPISREVFDSCYLLLAKTWSMIFEEGISRVAGPKMAGNILRDMAKAMTRDGDDPSRISGAFFNEIKRLSNVIAPGDDGWEIVPWQEAVNKHLIDEEDAAEVESAIIFFMLTWHVCPKQFRRNSIDDGARLTGGQVSSSTPMEFIASLKTLTVPASTGVTAEASSL